MKRFMDEDFLLSTDTAKRLYHEYAKGMPIVDYHCHIDPQEIALDRHFDNITQLWLGGDHYKWRQMRSDGIDEKYITGDASDWEKFEKWARTLEKAIGNPLYHWSHLELQRYFGYTGALNGRTARKVWDICNEALHRADMSARNIIRRSGVKLICTTDDPVDTLRWHEIIAEDESFEVKVLPAWRPDKAMSLEKQDYPVYIERLKEVSGIQITDFNSLINALRARAEYFAQHGCKISDHGMEYVMYVPATDAQLDAIFAKRLAGEEISRREELQFKTAFMLEMGRMYHSLGWAMQLHFGVKRDINERIYKALGADAGIDCISGYMPAGELADFINALEKEDSLPKTILYNLNPVDNAAVGTIIGCFQGEGVAGKLQHGAAWWFNDHKAGMIKQLTSLANLGLLGNFIGMLTDSRSFLSYTRHEYFRRILCELIGSWVENGEYPDDDIALEGLICGICFHNAVNYFGFKLD